MQQMCLYKGCTVCEFKLVLDQMLWGPDWSLVFVRISPVFRLFLRPGLEHSSRPVD